MSSKSDLVKPLALPVLSLLQWKPNLPNLGNRGNEGGGGCGATLEADERRHSIRPGPETPLLPGIRWHFTILLMVTAGVDFSSHSSEFAVFCVLASAVHGFSCSGTLDYILPHLKAC